MRFTLPAIAATLFASTAAATSALIHTIDGEHCVLTLKDFAGWSGTTTALGPYHPDTNSCSPPYTNMPRVVQPQDQKNGAIDIFYFFVDYHASGPGTIWFMHANPSKYAWTVIDPNVVGTVQEISWVEPGYPPAFSET